MVKVIISEVYFTRELTPRKILNITQIYIINKTYYLGVPCGKVNVFTGRATRGGKLRLSESFKSYCQKSMWVF